MKLLIKGKTKDVYALENGSYLLQFKDDLTGEDGKFDPGANKVGLSIDGAGRAGLAMTANLMALLNEKGVKTHFVDADLAKAQMTVLPAAVFGQGIEVICRFKAVGSFIKRYGAYIESGTDLPAYVEITLKDDERGDPLINQEALAALNILTKEEYEEITEMTRSICLIIKDHLAKFAMELYDIKLEFGRINGQVYLIDELSGGNMRVFQNGKSLDPLDLSAQLVGQN